MNGEILLLFTILGSAPSFRRRIAMLIGRLAAAIRSKAPSYRYLWSLNLPVPFMKATSMSGRPAASTAYLQSKFTSSSLPDAQAINK